MNTNTCRFFGHRTISETEEFKKNLREAIEKLTVEEKVDTFYYAEHNYEMIDNSRFCIVYCDEEYSPKKRKSGTRIALDYAKKKAREIICFFLKYIKPFNTAW